MDVTDLIPGQEEQVALSAVSNEERAETGEESVTISDAQEERMGVRFDRVVVIIADESIAGVSISVGHIHMIFHS